MSEATSACVQAFVENKWHVEVATGPTSPERNNCELQGVAIFEFNVTGSYHFRTRYRGDIEKYKKFLLDGDWDVIVFQGYEWPLYLALPILNQLKSKKILVSHGYRALLWTLNRKFPFGLGVWAFSVLESLKMLWWIKKIDRFVFLSNKKDFNSFYDHTLVGLCKHHGIRVIPNCVNSLHNLQVHENFRETHGIPPNAFLFLCVANYFPRKHQNFALRAFCQAAIPNSYLVFIGSEFNEWSNKFQNDEQVLRLNVSPKSIIWLEKQSREATLSAFMGCDVFILASSRETQPIVLLEAMSYGKPWIARDVGCISEMQGGICIKTEVEMTQSMRKVANSRLLYDSLSKQGFSAIEKYYNKELYSKKYRDIITETLHSDC